jgi:hypothetical protein
MGFFKARKMRFLDIQRRIPARLTICRIGLRIEIFERRFSLKFENDGDEGGVESDVDVL